MTGSHSDALVFFGATGDLAYKKIFPALQAMSKRGNLDIPIHGDPYISRRHAEIVWMGSAWGIRDLGSTNGTRVNGVPLEGSEVKLLGPDDVIELGFFSQLTVRGLAPEGQQ